MATPTESEVQSMWRNAVDIMEKHRVFADATATAGGEIDVLEQAVEGEYVPLAHVAAVADYRQGLSDPISPGRIRQFLDPILFEYAALLTGGGDGYTDVGNLTKALWEHFHNNSLTVESRNIGYDTSATTSDSFGGAINGTGAIKRLTVDEQDYNLEACHVELKRWRCRGDQNHGTSRHAEVFEVLGANAPKDALDRVNFGSGFQDFSRSVHAGTGDGGSLLRNSSFTTFSSSASPKFSGWDQTGTNSLFGQETTTTYRGSPGVTASDDAALALTGGGGDVTVKQTLASMTIAKLDPDTPYYFRVMANADKGGSNADGGTLTIKLGSQGATGTASTTIAALLGNGWVEVFIPLDKTCWPRQFNEDTFDVEITWASSTGGTLLIDDAIFVPWEKIDGTYWLAIGGVDATPWLLDDNLTFTDTGNVPANNKIQYWLWAAGLGYLPSTTGTPTFVEP